ncbi:hypothetical protein, partial [Faucicola boevrei]|uniref:hypothetical protein n=1 Tax=Faucicola boevrei TaxID=346665 RepID=UPI0014614ED7
SRSAVQPFSRSAVQPFSRSAVQPFSRSAVQPLFCRLLTRSQAKFYSFFSLLPFGGGLFICLQQGGA